jgi:Peptidase S46
MSYSFKSEGFPMPLLLFYISPMISRLLPLLPFLIAATALADEGMWLFNNPPLKQLKEKYQFEPSPQWLEHLQKASVRFNSGGSGSFVSANGLCITTTMSAPMRCKKPRANSIII